jgi:hypothetical protein
MADPKDEAQKIRDRVVRANDFTVLSRMRFFGFWPKGEGLPADPPDEAAERATLESEKKKLTDQAFASPEQLKKALDAERARRIAESRERRKERAAARAAAAAERRAAWAAERASRVVFAGEGHSSHLQHQTSDEGKLLALGLPILHTGGDLARFLGIELGRLRFLTYHRRTATLVHYHRFSLPKKSGGLRLISAPKPSLKRAQQVVFHELLEPAAARLHGAAHGFVAGRNVVSNALPHVGRAVVINLDLRDFFPSVTFRRVRGLFAGLGYSGAIRTLLALLCTEPPRVEVAVDGKPVRVAMGERRLPQGACTSPILTNLLCRRLDARLAGCAARLGYVYTRYADDLTFSADAREHGNDVSALLWRVRHIIVDEGFVENLEKTRVMRAGRRQEVTGVVVNERCTVAREEVRRLRAILHQAHRDGLAAQRRPGPDGELKSVEAFAAELKGRIGWVQMVDPTKGARLRAAFEALQVG